MARRTMKAARTRARRQAAVPFSLRVPPPLRERLRRYARERELEEATAARVLMAERLSEVEGADARERAMRWQMRRLRGLIERIEREGIREVSQSEIDAVFAEAEASDGSTPAASD